VTAKCQNGCLQMDVADNGLVQDDAYLDAKTKTKGQKASSHTDVGVQNIVEWLNVLYPNNHRFKIIRGLTVGYRVQFSIHIAGRTGLNHTVNLPTLSTFIM
jgi:two-component system LytT family sensor kinase